MEWFTARLPTVSSLTPPESFVIYLKTRWSIKFFIILPIMDHLKRSYSMYNTQVELNKVKLLTYYIFWCNYKPTANFFHTSQNSCSSWWARMLYFWKFHWTFFSPDKFIVDLWRDPGAIKVSPQCKTLATNDIRLLLIFCHSWGGAVAERSIRRCNWESK